MKTKLEALHKIFLDKFGIGDEVSFFFSPGRVNLIGEHIDYSGGLVMPSTIQFGTLAIARRNSSNEIRMISTNKKNKVTFSLNEIRFRPIDDWGNYPKGIFAEYASRTNLEGMGLDIIFSGDIPGGGLSSSASLELCTAVIIEKFSSYKLSDDQIENKKMMARLCQHSENEFNNVKCGIMDQAAIALGRENSALLLDCNNLEFSYLPVNLGEYTIVIGNTKKPRNLINSKYNERIIEIAESLKIINATKSIQNLCEINIEDLDEVLTLLKRKNLAQRVRHTVTEQDRVKRAAQALKDNDIALFGECLVGSHDSLRDDYEVTGIELDTLVAESLKCDGVIGARMTGAGFGGCTVNIVEKEKLNEFKAKAIKSYQEKIGYAPEFYESIPLNGASEVLI
jgi:galactokinase